MLGDESGSTRHRSWRWSLHFCEFRSSTSSDLLDAKLTEFGLEVEQLFFEVFFALAPELASFDLGS